jgi:O-antigen/teichoic acid export membrane protein
MMALTARSLPAPQYAAFAVWWTVATLLGTSFGVFEAYLARLVVAEISAGRNSATVTGLITGRAILVVGAFAVLLLALAPLLADRLFGGNLGAALLLPVFTALAAAQAIQRGSATGRRRFRAIAGQLASDGSVRLLITGLLVATGTETVTTVALGCCVSTATSLGVGGALCHPWIARPRLRGTEAAVRPLLYLLVGSIGPLLANNGSVPWLAGTDAVNAYTLGAFAGAITLSRIPTQFVSAAFSPLLAHLSQAVEDGDEGIFRHLRRSADVTAAMLGALFVAAFAALGPWFLTVYLGPRYHLPVLNLALLAAASSLMFVAVVQQAGLAALDRWSRIAIAWGLGTVAFLLVLALPGDALMRATLAPLASVAVALIVLSTVRPTIATGRGGRRQPASGDLVEDPADPLG